MEWTNVCCVFVVLYFVAFRWYLYQFFDIPLYNIIHCVSKKWHWCCAL